MYGYIYKTTNTVNGKIYIGQRKSDVFLGTEYLGSGKYLKCAIKHYGEDAFTVDMIDSADTKERLDELEIFYIQQYNATDHQIGYNIALGAVGGDTYSNLSEEDKEVRNARQQATRRANNQKYVVIHRGDVDKRVVDYMLDEYLADGWELGRSEKFQAAITEGIRGTKQSDEWIKKRLDSTWNKSQEELELRRQKHSEAARIQMANTPKEERVQRARNANKFKGKKCTFVHRGAEVKFIILDELQDYLDLGFKRGMKDGNK